MQAITVLLPDVDEGYTRQFIGRLVKRFGGVTISDARGLWTDNDGIECADNLTRLDCNIGLWSEHREWIIGQCRDASYRLSQDCIYLSVRDEEVHFIGQDDGRSLSDDDLANPLLGLSDNEEVA